MTGICVVSLVSSPDMQHFGEHASSVLSALRPQDQWIVHPQGLTLDERGSLADELRKSVARAETPGESIHVLSTGTQRLRSVILEIAETDYVLPLRAGDTLLPGALAAVGSSIDLAGPCDLLYGDELWRSSADSELIPHFRTAWGPFLSSSLLHPRTTAVISIGTFRGTDVELPPSDWAAVAAALAGCHGRIRHIAVTLVCHRGDPPTAVEPEQAIARGDSNPVRISIVIPSTGRPVASSDAPMVLSLVRSIERTLSRDADVQYVVVCDEGFPPSTAEALRQDVRRDLCLVDFRRGGEQFNFSMMVNRGALESDGDLLVFLNDDVEVLTQSWDLPIVQLATRESVGAVGVHLLFPDGSMQHVGMTTQLVDGGLPIQANYMRPGGIAGHRGVLRTTREVMAVCGAFVAIERQKFIRVGGFSGLFPSDHNDVDFCYKLRAQGLFNIVTPAIRAVHKESQTRESKRELSAEAAIQSRWGRWTAHDPWRSPNVGHEDSRQKPDAGVWSRGEPFVGLAMAIGTAEWDQDGLHESSSKWVEGWPSIRKRHLLQRRTPAPRLAAP